MVSLTQNVELFVPTTGDDNLSPEMAGFLGAVGKVMIRDESAFKENAAKVPHYLRPGAPRVAMGGGYAVVFPFLGVADEERTVVGSFLRMAPQHPKAIRADENRMDFDIWPGGKARWRLSRGMTKTHYVALSFFGRPLSDDEVDNEAIRREYFSSYIPGDPVTITLVPQYAASTKQVEVDK